MCCCQGFPEIWRSQTWCEELSRNGVVSKLFEYALLELFNDSLHSDNLQYDFKKGSGSKVFYVSLDANKAFDRVLHSGLYLKLLEKGVHSRFVKLLQCWYSCQVCVVQWKSGVGDLFQILCGVRQGSILSPILFSIYLDNVIDDLRHSGCGLHIGSYFIGCVVYADDIMLLSCSCQGIQRLVDIFAWIMERSGIYVLTLVKLTVSL